MVKYICRNCGFKTEIKNVIPKKCPYCAEAKGFKKEEDAEELLDEED